MKVVFLQDVPGVARAGEVKSVKDGYARNYLFPKSLAALATPAEVRRLETKREADVRHQDRFEHEADAVAQELAEIAVTLKVRAGSKERLYGSVTSADIAKEIKRVSGHEIDKRLIELEAPIRELGSHQVAIRLTKSVTATVNVLVEAEQEPEQGEKEKGKAKPKEKAKKKPKAEAEPAQGEPAQATEEPAEMKEGPEEATEELEPEQPKE